MQIFPSRRHQPAANPDEQSRNIKLACYIRQHEKARRCLSASELRRKELPCSAALNTAARIFHIRLWSAFSVIIRRCFLLHRCYAASQKAVLNMCCSPGRRPTLAFWAYPEDHTRFFQGALHKNWMKLTQMLPHIQLSPSRCAPAPHRLPHAHILRGTCHVHRTRAVFR